MTLLPPRAAEGPAVILAGPPGAGKSTVGPLLAALLGTEFADADTLVAEAAGKPVSDIFIQDGEAAFRALERSVVPEAIARHQGVLALGGGFMLWPGSRPLLSGQRVVYLETSLAAVVARSGLGGPHPPVPGNPRGRLKQLLDERRPAYEDIAWFTVRTDERTPEQIAAEIAAATTASIAGPARLPE